MKKLMIFVNNMNEAAIESNKIAGYIMKNKRLPKAHTVFHHFAGFNYFTTYEITFDKNKGNRELSTNGYAEGINNYSVISININED